MEPALYVDSSARGQVAIWSGPQVQELSKSTMQRILREAAPKVDVEIIECDENLDRFDAILLPYITGGSESMSHLPAGLAQYIRNGGVVVGGTGPHAPPLSLLGIMVGNGDTPTHVEYQRQDETAIALGLGHLPDSVAACQWIWGIEESCLPSEAQLLYRADGMVPPRSPLFMLPEGRGQVWFFGAEFEGAYEAYPQVWRDLFVMVVLQSLRPQRVICIQADTSQESSELAVSCTSLAGEDLVSLLVPADAQLAAFRQALASKLGCSERDFKLVLPQAQVAGPELNDTRMSELFEFSA